MTADSHKAGTAPSPSGDARDVSVTLDEAVRFAIILLSKGKGGDAVKIFERAGEMAPDRADIIHFHGIALHQTASSAEGLALIERSLAMEPDQAGWWNNRGNVLRECGHLDEAIDSFRRAIELSDRFAEPYNNLGIVQREKRNLDIADACFRKAIELDPEFADAYSNHGNLLVSRNQLAEGLKQLLRSVTLRPHNLYSKRSLAYAYGQLGEYGKAQDIYREWLDAEPSNPIALHHLAAVSGTIPERASDDYVREIFDAFAPSFDTKLEHLDYRAPQLVNEALRRHASGRAPLMIADAGCGTGLCGPQLRTLASNLIGVDLSPVMIGKARDRSCYDALVEGELTAFLGARPGSFDAVVSADTLCYFGKLTDVLAAAARSLKHDGLLVFTVEANVENESDIVLNHHGRYAHARHYVETELVGSGLLLREILEVVLRNESGVPVNGFVVTAERPRLES